MEYKLSEMKIWRIKYFNLFFSVLTNTHDINENTLQEEPCKLHNKPYNIKQNENKSSSSNNMRRITTLYKKEYLFTSQFT